MTDSLIRTGSAPIDPSLCGQVERLYSPLWMSGLTAPEVGEEFDRLGLELMPRYFATRAAPMGAVSGPTVVATFFNFSPAAVSASIPAIWERFTPTQLLEAQRRGLARAFERAFAGLDGAIIDEALALLRVAAQAAAARPEGRPLFAGYASLPWPEAPQLALWHAHYMLREFRGDGHIAVLVEEGLTGIEALILHIALVPMLGPIFRPSRAWTDDEWDAAMERLRDEDWITAADEPTLTANGRERRAKIEQRTDELNVPAYAAVGTEGCQRLLQLGAPIAEALTAGGSGFLRSLLPDE